jgi:hypothetical protein
MRGLEGVDLYSYDNARNGAYVGSVVPGEWLTYTVFGQTDSTYWVEVYATAPTAGSFKVRTEPAYWAYLLSIFAFFLALLSGFV